jgi:hypothetical protein
MIQNYLFSGLKILLKEVKGEVIQKWNLLFFLSHFTSRKVVISTHMIFPKGDVSHSVQGQGGGLQGKFWGNKAHCRSQDFVDNVEENPLH